MTDGTEAILALLAGREGASGVLTPEVEGATPGAGGVPIHYQVFGRGEPAVLLIPPWQIVHSRIWKLQVPYLARYGRVVTLDVRGTGRSGRPRRGYDYDTVTDDIVAVLDALRIDRAAVVGHSRSGNHAVLLAHREPARVERLVLIAPFIWLRGAPAWAAFLREFHRERETHEGWERYNASYWRTHYDEFLWWFFTEMFSEPYGLKARFDAVSWGRQTTAEVLVATIDESGTREEMGAVLSGLRQPVLLIYGEEDRIRPYPDFGRPVLDRLPDARLLMVEGGGHAPHVRDPVLVNRAIRDFLGLTPRPRVFRHALTAPRRVLWVCSPIGLGHVRRDLAIARALRERCPGLEIDWLAADPVRSAVQAAGERVHPASDRLASESARMEAHAGDHRVNAFLALWDMDEELTANFMTFLDVVEQERYDCWIGDEAWDLDHFLHENPSAKTAPFVFLTDFIGMLPVDDRPQSAEARLCWDWNAEMIAHVERYPAIRDRAIFLGDPEDVLDRPFGPGLPEMRAWTERHFTFAGYVLGFDPDALPDPAALKRSLGYEPDRPLVVATAGGTAVGAALLRMCADALPLIRERVPGVEMLLAAGLRVPAGALPARQGLTVRAYVPDLFCYLACCDLAVTQGGLATCMELVAARRPFLYFPLEQHFEQTFHVHRRLVRYGADGRMDYRATSAQGLAAAVVARLGRPPAYRRVPAGAERTVAALITPLIGAPPA